MGKLLNSDSPVMTYAMVLIVVIVAVVGGIAVLTDNYDDDFNRYIDDLTKLALAVAGLGFARGVKGAADTLAKRPQTVKADVTVEDRDAKLTAPKPVTGETVDARHDDDLFGNPDDEEYDPGPDTQGFEKRDLHDGGKDLPKGAPKTTDLEP